MNRRNALLLVSAILSLTGLLVAGRAFWDSRRVDVADRSGEAAPAEQANPYSAADSSDDPHKRILFRVLPEDRPPGAYIAYQKHIGRYAVGDKLPPDQAVLARVADGQVVLQPPGGEPLTLPLADMPAEDRMLFTEPVVIENIDDIPEPEFDDPEDRRKIEELTDPYASCGEIKDDERRRACERRLSEQLNEQTNACDEKDTREEALKCHEEIERQFQNRPLEPDEE